MKKVVAVPPYEHKGIINFRKPAFDAWIKEGGDFAHSHYPWRCLHGMVEKVDFPLLCHRNNVAQLRFIQPINRKLDAFPECLYTEIIPMIWDCWPCLYDRMETWMRRYKVKTAIFTSSQEARDMKERMPYLNVITITEGINTETYQCGKELKDREIDLLEFGRSNDKIIGENPVFNDVNSIPFNHVTTNGKDGSRFTDSELFAAMQDAKVTICVPRCDVDTVAGGVETLTQRYWEAMLSRMVIVGRAPKELIDLIGYNPVIDVQGFSPKQVQKHILDIVNHIEDYQDMVDKNRETALKMGDWTLRMNKVQNWLVDIGYQI